MRNCPDCDAKPGEIHLGGCDVERCCLCGGQAISCNCVYTVNDFTMDTLEEKYPDIYDNGPTDEMSARRDAEEEKYGGRLPWTGEWPLLSECREYNLWCYENKGGTPYWVPCGKEHPRAKEDLNRLLQVAFWDKIQRKWVMNSAQD